MQRGGFWRTGCEKDHEGAQQSKNSEKQFSLQHSLNLMLTEASQTVEGTCGFVGQEDPIFLSVLSVDLVIPWPFLRMLHVFLIGLLTVGSSMKELERKII